MQDILIIIAHMYILQHAMKKSPYYTSYKNVYDGLGGFFVCLFLFAFVRGVVYLAVYGAQFPFDPSQEMEWVSAAISIVFWWALIYYRPITRMRDMTKL